jgi:UDP-N-acetylmuramyl tripeptide synthase
MHALLEALDHPEKNLRCIHVAGTKGKGSVVAFVESILRESGYKVGCYSRYEYVETCTSDLKLLLHVSVFIM